MKVAILGGGITGLAAAYDLSKQGYEVSLYEKSAHLGGLASGFKKEGWDWALDFAYHHLFESDTDIMGFAETIGFDGIFKTSPQTASLYEVDGKLVIYPLESPTDLLRFPRLGIVSKLRAGLTLTILKYGPHLSIYDKVSAMRFLKLTMGEPAWKVLWQALFRKKFGKYADNILAWFIWSRVKKRSQKLCYVRGGFQALTDHIERVCIENGAIINKGVEVATLKRKGKQFIVNKKAFDIVISTLPTQALVKVGEEILPATYVSNLTKIKYLHATNLIIETESPIFEKAYWVNVSEESIPIMVLVQHTNLTDKKHYGNKHLLYIGNYVDGDSKLLKMDKEEALKYFLPHVERIAGKKIKPTDSWYFKAGFAQPIYDENYMKYRPKFVSPVKNLYIANLDMTYPHDRGTNYAVKLGREVARLIA